MAELTLEDGKALAKTILVFQLISLMGVFALVGMVALGLGSLMGAGYGLLGAAMFGFMAYAHSYDGRSRRWYNRIPTVETTTEALENRTFSDGDSVFGGAD
jgi:uncharacterized membrane protein